MDSHIRMLRFDIGKISKADAGIAAAALAAGFLVSLSPFAMLALLLVLGAGWFAVERFEDAALLLILYLPFQVALNLGAGYDVASGRVLILALFALWLLRSLKDKRIEVDHSLPTVCLLLFLLLSALSTFWAYDADRAGRKLLVFFSVWPLYFILTSFPDKRRFVSRAVKLLLAGGSVIALIGLGQFSAQFIVGINPIFDFFAQVTAPIFLGNTFAAEVVANPSWLVNVGGRTLLRAFSIFSDPHVFSFYLGLLLPLSLSLFLSDQEALKDIHLGRKSLLAASSVILAAELLTFSRGGYLGMVAGLGVTLLFFLRYLDMRQKKVLLSATLIALLYLGGTDNPIKTRLLSSLDTSEGSNVGRMENWRQGWTVFSDNFFGGVGIGNYSLMLDPTTAYRTPVYAHNLYLDLGAEMGVFSLLLWLGLIGSVLVGLFRAGIRTRDKLVRHLAAGLMGALTWYSVHSFFDDCLFAPNVLSVLAVILALSVLIIRSAKMEKE